MYKDIRKVYKQPDNVDIFTISLYNNYIMKEAVRELESEEGHENMRIRRVGQGA